MFVQHYYFCVQQMEPWHRIGEVAGNFSGAFELVPLGFRNNNKSASPGHPTFDIKCKNLLPTAVIRM